MSLRSLLFVPGDSDKKLAKGAGSGADALILDLEDSVAAGRKVLARDMVGDYLKHRQGGPELWVRINPLDDGVLEDCVALVRAAPDGIVVPKVSGPADLIRLGHFIDALERRDGVQKNIRLLPVATETARAPFGLAAYAATPLPRLFGLTWGAVPGAECIRLEDVDLLVENDAPLCTYDVGAASEQASLIASRVAAFIGDGAVLQFGLGRVPDALLRQLTGRRGLRLHSGMMSDGARALAEAGSLDRDWLHSSCVHVGTSDYYAWPADRTDFAVRACNHTPAASLLANLPRLMAVNSALRFDLFGQANLEMLDGRMVSGVGGAADFSRGASLSPGGASMIALPATSGRGQACRIVPVLDGPCSIPRHDVDVIVTEFGAADLRDCSAIRRADKIIATAAPQHQGALQDGWRTMAMRL